MYVIKNICDGVVHVHMTAGVQLPTKIIQEWENPSRDIVFYILPKCIWMKKMQAKPWKQERKIFALRISKKLDSKPSGKQDILLNEKRRDIKRPPTTVSAQDCVLITCSLDAQTNEKLSAMNRPPKSFNFPKRNPQMLNISLKNLENAKTDSAITGEIQEIPGSCFKNKNIIMTYS